MIIYVEDPNVSTRKKNPTGTNKEFNKSKVYNQYTKINHVFIYLQQIIEN